MFSLSNIAGNVAETVATMRLDLPNLPVGELAAELEYISSQLSEALKQMETTQRPDSGMEALRGFATKSGNAETTQNAITQIDTLLGLAGGSLNDFVENQRDNLQMRLEEIDSDPSTTTVQEAGLEPAQLNWNLAGIEAAAGQAGLLSALSATLREQQEPALAEAINKLDLGDDVKKATDAAVDPIDHLQAINVAVHNIMDRVDEMAKDVSESMRAHAGLPEDFDQAVALATTADLDAYISQMAREAEPEVGDFDGAAVSPGTQTTAGLDAYVSQMVREAEAPDEDYDVSPNRVHENERDGLRERAESPQGQRGPHDQGADRARAAPPPTPQQATQQADQMAAAAELEQEQAAGAEQERAEEQVAAEAGDEGAEPAATAETAEQEETAAGEAAEQEVIERDEIDAKIGEPVGIEQVAPLSEEGMTDFQVDVATLDEVAEARVIEAVADAEAAGTLDRLDTEELMAREQEIQDRREDAEVHRQDQERARAEGDLQAARDSAAASEEALQTAAWLDGGQAAERVEGVDVVEAGADAAALDVAAWNRESAEEDTGAATDYAESGDYEVSEMYAGDAAAAEGVAEAYADEGEAEDEDAGGSRYDESSTYDT